MDVFWLYFYPSYPFVLMNNLSNPPVMCWNSTFTAAWFGERKRVVNETNGYDG